MGLTSFGSIGLALLGSIAFATDEFARVILSKPVRRVICMPSKAVFATKKCYEERLKRSGYEESIRKSVRKNPKARASA